MSDISIEERLQALESKDKEVLIKSNIEVKINAQNIQTFDFTKYKQLKFVFFRKNTEGIRNAEKIFIIRLSDNSVPVIFEESNFYIWIDGAKKYADIRRQTNDNTYAYCDIYGIT